MHDLKLRFMLSTTQKVTIIKMFNILIAFKFNNLRIHPVMWINSSSTEKIRFLEWGTRSDCRKWDFISSLHPSTRIISRANIPFTDFLFNFLSGLIETFHVRRLWNYVKYKYSERTLNWTARRPNSDVHLAFLSSSSFARNLPIPLIHECRWNNEHKYSIRLICE